MCGRHTLSLQAAFVGAATMNCIPHQPAGANPRSRSHSCTPKPSKPRSIIDKLKRWLAGGVAEQHLPKKQRTTKKHFRGPSTVRGAPAWSMPLESRFTVEVDANVHITTRAGPKKPSVSSLELKVQQAQCFPRSHAITLTAADVLAHDLVLSAEQQACMPGQQLGISLLSAISPASQAPVIGLNLEPCLQLMTTGAVDTLGTVTGAVWRSNTVAVTDSRTIALFQLPEVASLPANKHSRMDCSTPTAGKNCSSDSSGSSAIIPACLMSWGRTLRRPATSQSYHRQQLLLASATPSAITSGLSGSGSAAPEYNVSAIALSPTAEELALVVKGCSGPARGRTAVHRFEVQPLQNSSGNKLTYVPHGQVQAPGHQACWKPAEEVEVGTSQVAGVEWPAGLGMVLQLVSEGGRVEALQPRLARLTADILGNTNEGSGASMPEHSRSSTLPTPSSVARVTASETPVTKHPNRATTIVRTAAAYEDGSVEVWSSVEPPGTTTRLPLECVFPPGPGRVASASLPPTTAWSHDGSLLAVAAHMGVSVWAFGDEGPTCHTPLLLHALPVRAPVVAWSSSGVLAIGSRITPGLKLAWPSGGVLHATGQQHAAGFPHGSDDTSAIGPTSAFSPRPSFSATWLHAGLRTPEPVSSLAWSPDGSGLLAGGVRGKLLVWHLPQLGRSA